MNFSVIAATATRNTPHWSNKLTSFGNDRPWTNYDCSGIPHNMTFMQVSGMWSGITMTHFGFLRTKSFYRAHEDKPSRSIEVIGQRTVRFN